MKCYKKKVRFLYACFEPELPDEERKLIDGKSCSAVLSKWQKLLAKVWPQFQKESLKQHTWGYVIATVCYGTVKRKSLVYEYAVDSKVLYINFYYLSFGHQQLGRIVVGPASVPVGLWRLFVYNSKVWACLKEHFFHDWVDWISYLLYQMKKCVIHHPLTTLKVYN